MGESHGVGTGPVGFGEAVGFAAAGAVGLAAAEIAGFAGAAAAGLSADGGVVGEGEEFCAFASEGTDPETLDFTAPALAACSAVGLG